MNKTYETPQVEVIEVVVEKGFAVSPGNGDTDGGGSAGGFGG